MKFMNENIIYNIKFIKMISIALFKRVKMFVI